MPTVENRKLTPKENYLRILTGQMPEWVPVYTMGAPLPNDEPIPLGMVYPAPINPDKPFGGKDVWGVKWVGNTINAGATLPEPNNFILDDITRWRDVIKAPDLTCIDWEQTCKKDIENAHIDREKTALGQTVVLGAFQMLVAFMGFTEALIAMYEEPEEVKALVDYIGDFYIGVEEICMPYYKPDVLALFDDTCSKTMPFFSEEMFRELFLPFYIREAEMANNLGIPIQFHNCGMAADFIQICHEEFNVAAWDPAQTVNDLVAFKKRNGRDIAILGGWDPSLDLLVDGVTDEQIHDSVKESFDLLAPDGGYAFLGNFLGPMDDPEIQRKNKVLAEAAMSLGNTYYD